MSKNREVVTISQIITNFWTSDLYDNYEGINENKLALYLIENGVGSKDRFEIDDEYVTLNESRNLEPIYLIKPIIYGV